MDVNIVGTTKGCEIMFAVGETWYLKGTPGT